MNYAGIMVKVFDGKVGMSLTDTFGDGRVTAPLDQVMLPLIYVEEQRGMGIFDMFKHTVKALERGEIDDPAKDRYSNAKIINSYQSLAQFTGWVNTNFV